MKYIGNFVKLSFYRAKKPLFIILAGMAVIETLLILLIAGTQQGYMKPYEIIFQVAWIPVVFIFAVAAVVIMCGVLLRSYFDKQKGIYTILTLPANPESFVIGNIITSSLMITAVIAMQILLFFVLYPLAESLANSYSAVPAVMAANSATIVRESLNNGLFLATLRSAFFHFLLPIGFDGILMLITFIVSWATISVVSPLVRFGSGKHVLGLGLTLAALLISIYYFLNMSVRVTEAYVEQSIFTSAYPPIVLLLGITALLWFYIKDRINRDSLIWGGAK